MFKSTACLTLFCFLSGTIFSQTKLISYSDKHISYEGRIVYTNDAAVLMWPGISLKINFIGTGISGEFKDADTCNYYNVIIDNDRIYKIQFDTAKKTVALASNLSYSKHSIQLFKRTEWDKGK